MSMRSLFLLCCLAGSYSVAAAEPPGKPNADPNAVIVTGKVVDLADRRVAGAEVTVERYAQRIVVKTDAEGAFRAAVTRFPSGGISCALFARGPQGDLGESIVNSDDGTVEPIKLVLKPARPVEVRVVDANGKPIADAEVHIHSNFRRFTSGRTGADGRWLTAVPADTKEWKFFALKSKCGFDYTQAERTHGSLEPLLPLPPRITLTLNGARPPLKIKTLHQNGKPVIGIKVGPWYVRKAGHESELNGLPDEVFVKSDDNGVAVIDWLPLDNDQEKPQEYLILAASNDLYLPNHRVAVPVVDGKPAAEITMTFSSYVTLSGRITTPDGRPAADVRVTAAGSGATRRDFRATTRTDAEGRYQFQAHGDLVYIIVAAQEKEKLAAPCKSGVVLRADKPMTDVDFVLGPGTLVHGVVVQGKEKRPAVDATVVAAINKGRIPAELNPVHIENRSFSTSGSSSKRGHNRLMISSGSWLM